MGPKRKAGLIESLVTSAPRDRAAGRAVRPRITDDSRGSSAQLYRDRPKFGVRFTASEERTRWRAGFASPSSEVFAWGRGHHVPS